MCHEYTTGKEHPVNLALLQRFFNDTSLKHVDGDTLFENPLKAETPAFRIHNHTMTYIIAHDRKAHLSLQKMANIKSEMRSFKSNENIHKKEGGSYYVVSANKASSVTL